MVWPNLALVLPLSLPLPSSRAFPSSCIMNKLLISDRYKLGKFCKRWRFCTSSHPLPFVAVDHPPLQKKSSPFPHACTRDIYSKSQCHASRTLPYYVKGFHTAEHTGGRLCTSATFRTVRNLTDVCAYYDRSMTTVREQTFDGYCIL